MGTLFPKDFLWGTETSSFQSEGGLTLGDRGPSIWDFSESHLPKGDFLKNGPDSLNHIDEDIALLKELGVKAFRMSLSWTRILPDGAGKISTFGIDLYKTIFHKLLNAGIEPWVTIFHWDYPLALEKEGGWSNPDSPKWFANYCEVVGRAFSGLISHYILMNEPQCFVELGYFTGEKAPFKKLSRLEVLNIGHNALKGAALGAKALRAVSSIPLSLGMAETYSSPYPEDENDLHDIEAAELATEAFTNRLFCLPWWGDASYLGVYPDNWVKGFDVGFKGNALECLGDYDFFGLNLYNGFPVKSSQNGFALVDKAGIERNSLGWGITPKAISFAASYCASRYGKPVYITENGVTLFDKVEDGKVKDSRRSKFLDDYLLELSKAIKKGADVRGYFYWSFLDNLEWEQGYAPRFGLIYTDYQNGAKRIKKDSFAHYSSIISSSGETLLDDSAKIH